MFIIYKNKIESMHGANGDCMFFYKKITKMAVLQEYSF